jgi:hypothetical protein
LSTVGLIAVIADRGRVGRVGFEQHRRTFAAIDLAAEIGRHGQGELRFAAGQAPGGVVFADGTVEAEIGAVGERLRNGALIDRMVAADECGRQVFRIGIDGEAEQEQLHQRHRQGQRDRAGVAPHLQEFLVQHGDETGPADHADSPAGAPDEASR